MIILVDQYSLWTTKFNSLLDLIQHHKQNSISRTSKIVLQDVRIPGGPQGSPGRGRHPGGHGGQPMGHGGPQGGYGGGHQGHHGGGHGGHQGGHHGGPQQQTFNAVAAYRFSGEERNELSFEINEEINVRPYFKDKLEIIFSD